MSTTMTVSLDNLKASTRKPPATYWLMPSASAKSTPIMHLPTRPNWKSN